MVIEDNATVQLCLTKILSDYNPIVVANGEEALKLLPLHSSIELVISDYQLPGWSGVKTLQRIRSLSPRMKSILISAVDPQKLDQLATHAQADAWLHKPFSCEDLRKQVSRLLS